MKKKRAVLTLSKETVRRLVPAGLDTVAGGVTRVCTIPTDYTCGALTFCGDGCNSRSCTC